MSSSLMDRAQGLAAASFDGFALNVGLGSLALLAGWFFGHLMGLAISRLVASRLLASFARSACPLLGVAGALPLAYFLFFRS